MTAVAVPTATAVEQAGPFLLHPHGPPVPSSPDRLHASVDARHLLTAVRDIETAMRGRPPVPVLNTVHVRPVAGGLQLTSYDYEVTARRTIPARLASGGPVLVPPAWLRRAALAAGAGSLTLAAREGDDSEELVASDGVVRRRARLGIPLEEWPVLSHLTDRGKTADLGCYDWATLQRLISPVFAASRDDTPPILTALRLTVGDGLLVAHATDRYRLVRAQVPLAAQQTPPGEYLLPAAALKRILSRFGRGEVLQVSIDSVPGAALLRLDSPGGTVTFPLMGGAYPPVAKLYPAREDFRGAVLVDRRALLTMLGNVDAGDRTPVRLTVDQDLEVATDSGWESTSGHVAPVGDWRRIGDGSGIAMGLNVGYLTESLTSLPHDVVELAYSEPTKPLLISGIDPDVDRAPTDLTAPAWAAAVDPSRTHLLMPTRVAGRMDR